MFTFEYCEKTSPNARAERKRMSGGFPTWEQAKNCLFREFNIRNDKLGMAEKLGDTNYDKVYPFIEVTKVIKKGYLLLVADTGDKYLEREYFIVEE